MDTCMDDALKLDYLNGLLSEKDRTRLEEHLAACPGCRREIEGLRYAVTAVAGLTPPYVPGSWTDAVKNRLRTRRPSPVAAVPLIPAPARRRTNVFQYGAIAAGVTAALALLFWLIMGGTVQRWLPGLSTSALGIVEPRAAKTVDLVTWILSLHALIFVPSIIDHVYRLVRRSGRSGRPVPFSGFFAC